MNRSFQFHLQPKASTQLKYALCLMLIGGVAAAVVCHCILLEWVWLRSPILTGDALALKLKDVPDWDLLIGGVKQASTFAQTLPWWHTTWVWPYGYWRPLSSLAFWLEYRAFGERFNFWFATLIASHLAFTTAFAWFAFRLTKRWYVALIAVVIFAVPRPADLALFNRLSGYDSDVPGDVILDYWKNTVEAWLGTFVMLAFVAATRQRYSLAFVLGAVSVCFKETGWLTFPLIVLIAFADPEQGRRAIPLRAWLIAFLVAAPLIAIKAWVGGHMIQSGPNFRSNGAWVARYLGQIEGCGLKFFNFASWPSALLGLSLTAIAVLARRLGPAKSLLAAIIALAACCLAQSLAARVTPDVSLVILLDPSLGLLTSLELAAYFGLAFLALVNPPHRRLMLLVYAMFCLESLIVIVNPKQTPHIYYIPSALCALLLSVAFTSAAETILLTRSRLGNAASPSLRRAQDSV